METEDNLFKLTILTTLTVGGIYDPNLTSVTKVTSEHSVSRWLRCHSCDTSGLTPSNGIGKDLTSPPYNVGDPQGFAPQSSPHLPRCL